MAQMKRPLSIICIIVSAFVLMARLQNQGRGTGGREIEGSELVERY